MAANISIFFRPYQIPPGAPLSACLDVARAMDEAGLHSIAFGDHLLIGNHPENYPYGAFTHASTSAWTDPLLTLCALAAVTKRLFLSTGVLICPLRPPVLLAKQIATLDVMSNGRAQLALGVGWQREEYEAQRIPWDERYKRLDEGVRACRALWGEQPVTFRSPNVVVEGAWALPRPIQARVPLLFGVAMTPRHAQRIAELGDGWFPVRATPDAIREGVDRLAEALAARGRDIASQHVRVGVAHALDRSGEIDVERSLSVIPQLKAAGGTIFQVSSPPEPKNMDEIFRFIEQVGQAAKAYA